MIIEIVIGTLLAINLHAPAVQGISLQNRLESPNWKPAPEPPVIKTSGKTTICEGQVAVLTASPKAHRYLWYKDGQPQLTQEARLVVADAGNYSVSTIDEQGQSSVASRPVKITVLPKPGKPVVSGPRTGCDGDVISLKVEDQLDGAVEFEWHRQMESTPFARGSQVEYRVQGDAVLYVTAKSAGGCISDQIETVDIKSSTPQGTFQVSHQAINKGGLVSFISSIQNAASYRWNFWGW